MKCKHKVSRQYLKALRIMKADNLRYGVNCLDCGDMVYDKKPELYKIPTDLKKIKRLKIHFQGKQNNFEILNHAIETYGSLTRVI